MPLLCGLDLRKISNLAMWPLWAAAGAGGAILARPAAVAGREWAQGGLGVPYARFRPEVGGGGGAGGVARQRRPLPAAVGPAPASFRPGHANGRRGRLQQGLGVVPGRLHSRGS
jgi:hypothetical protein